MLRLYVVINGHSLHIFKPLRFLCNLLSVQKRLLESLLFSDEGNGGNKCQNENSFESLTGNEKCSDNLESC